MTREHRVNIQYVSACAMLFCGVALSVAGFLVSPVGEISDSVLWFAAQTMIYAGSVFGVNVYVNDKFQSITDKINKVDDKVNNRISPRANSVNNGGSNHAKKDN